MNKEFCTYEQALELKELGFDEPCLKFYAEGKLILGINADNGDTNSKLNQYNELFVSAPLKQQVFRWFRGKGFLISLDSHDENNYEFYIKWLKDKSILSDLHPTYEEAEDACINKLIEICKNKQHES